MSFISVEPQSRVLLESHTNYLLSQFDTQLRIIPDRYLAFFQERRSIEAVYVDSLRKLYRKAKTIDASIDPHPEPNTTRTAWDTVRDNVGREADAQQAFIDMLAKDVIQPLQKLKEWSNDTKDWNKDNLKLSASRYADHAENRILKLQQAYSRKYQPQQSHHAADVSQRLQNVPNERFASGVSNPFRRWWADQQEPEPAKATSSVEVCDDDCREAVADLNRLRRSRVEDLEAGYDSLEQLVFAPTIKKVLLKYMGGMVKACAKHDDIAKSTRAEVVNALGRNNTSDLRVSFRRALSFSTPPLTLYRNYHPGEVSSLIFGVPLVDQGVNEDNVPKVMRMCIDEVEKRGLNIYKIYSSDSTYDTEVRKWLRRVESEKSFAFTSTDNIHSVAALLKRYLSDLPEPLFVLSMKESNYYAQDRDKYTKENFSLLRSKIRELHPVHRASLEALLRHLLRVSSHSDNNGMSVKELSTRLCCHVLGGYEVCEGGINLKEVVMEDLIRNAHTLFDEPPSHSPPAPSIDVAETKSTPTHGSLILSAEMPEFTELQATGSTSRRRPGLVVGIPSSTESSFSSLLSLSDASSESCLTTLPIDLMSPLLGLSSSTTLTEGVETTAQEVLTPDARATEALPDSTPPDVVPLRAPTSVAEWQLHLWQLPQDPDALTIPQSPPSSVLSSMSDFSLSSATSWQTGT